MDIITLQPAPNVDHITDDGTELTRLPYPFHVRADDGGIERQDFWQGSVARVVGFVADLNRQEVDLWWRDAAKDPQRAVGMYVITQDDKGDMATQMTAISTVKVTQQG